MAKLGLFTAPALLLGVPLAAPAMATPDHLPGLHSQLPPSSRGAGTGAQAGPPGPPAGRGAPSEGRSPVATRLAALHAQVTPPPITVPPLDPPPPLPGLDQSDPPLTVPSLPSLPPVTVPPAIPAVPGLAAPTTAPTAPTTPPPPKTAPAAVRRASAPAPTGSQADGDVAAPSGPAAPEIAPSLPPGLFGGALAAVPPPVAAALPGSGYRRSASRAMTTLAFSVLVAVAVLLFLALQGRFDRHDPKLAGAPIDHDDDMVGFG